MASSTLWSWTGCYGNLLANVAESTVNLLANYVDSNWQPSDKFEERIDNLLENVRGRGGWWQPSGRTTGQRTICRGLLRPSRKFSIFDRVLVPSPIFSLPFNGRYRTHVSLRPYILRCTGVQQARRDEDVYDEVKPGRKWGEWWTRLQEQEVARGGGASKPHMSWVQPECRVGLQHYKYPDSSQLHGDGTGWQLDGEMTGWQLVGEMTGWQLDEEMTVW
jgi:hypothetical protein